MNLVTPAVLAVIILLLVSSIALDSRAHGAEQAHQSYLPLTTDGRPIQPTPPAVDELAYRREVIRLVNEYRVANGCPAAAEHPALMNAAQVWSDYMRQEGIFEHSSVKFPQWYISRDYSPDARENIARGQETALEVFSDWKSSTNHNRTLLSCRYAPQGATYDLGVGLNGRLWTLALGERLP